MKFLFLWFILLSALTRKNTCASSLRVRYNGKQVLFQRGRYRNASRSRLADTVEAELARRLDLKAPVQRSGAGVIVNNVYYGAGTPCRYHSLSLGTWAEARVKTVDENGVTVTSKETANDRLLSYANLQDVIMPSASFSPTSATAAGATIGVSRAQAVPQYGTPLLGVPKYVNMPQPPLLAPQVQAVATAAVAVEPQRQVKSAPPLAQTRPHPQVTPIFAAAVQRQLAEARDVVKPVAGRDVIAPMRIIGGHGIAPSHQIVSQATASHRAKKTIQVFAPGGGTTFCQYAYLAVQADPELALEVVGRSRASYDAYLHERPQGPNHYTFAQSIIDGTLNEYFNIPLPGTLPQQLPGTPLLHCDALIFGSRGGQSVLPYMWKQLGDKVPPVVVINSGITQTTNPIVRYREYWPASAIVFLLVCGSDETFAEGQSPSQYLQNTLAGVRPDTATTAVLYVKELTHMPDPELMAKVYPEMAKSVIYWKENGKPDIQQFKKIVGAISAHDHTPKYTGALLWKVGATATAWDSREFPRASW